MCQNDPSAGMHLHSTAGPCLLAGVCEVFCEASNSLTTVLIWSALGFGLLSKIEMGVKPTCLRGCGAASCVDRAGRFDGKDLRWSLSSSCSLSSSWWSCILTNTWRGNYVRRIEQYASII